MGERNSIIIIDNDVALLDMLKGGLSARGYQCETTASVKTAIRYIGETSFDIMVTDIIMPDGDVFELIKKAKKLRPDMAVIIMSDSMDESSYDRSMEKGASDFIEKPVTLARMLVRIKHARLHEKLREMSITDELTGLYNRRGFFTLAEHQLKMANRLKRGVYLLFADFDKLKILNDTFGHGEGDLALIKTAEILKITFRDSDIIARIGGDEFVVVPIGTAEDNVDKIIARFQSNIETHNSQRIGKGELSLSVGVAYYDPYKACSVHELLSLADRSMYERKKLKQM